MKRGTFNGNWVGNNEARKWKEGSIVLIHRIERKQEEHGMLTVAAFFRPDWVDKEWPQGYGECEYMLLKN